MKRLNYLKNNFKILLQKFKDNFKITECMSIKMTLDDKYNHDFPFSKITKR